MTLGFVCSFVLRALHSSPSLFFGPIPWSLLTPCSCLTVYLFSFSSFWYPSCCCVCLVMSDSCNPIDCQSPRLSARLLHLWDSPGENTGAGCHFHLQGISLTQESNPGLLHCRQTFYWLSYEGSPWEPSLRGKGVMTTLASPGCPGVSWASGFLLPALCQGVFMEGDASPWNDKVACFSIVWVLVREHSCHTTT